MRAEGINTTTNPTNAYTVPSVSIEMIREHGARHGISISMQGELLGDDKYG